MRSPTGGAIVCLAILLSGLPAGAQEEQRVALHGFGSWAYGNTDANAYPSGQPGGSYDDSSFALNVSASLSDRLRIVSHVGVEDEEGGSSIELDYAFAEWKLSDRIALRAGKVKHPFGISTEVLHVGTLRPLVRP